MNFSGSFATGYNTVTWDSGVILQTSPPPQIADLPPDDLQWCWKTIADLPSLQIFLSHPPKNHFNRSRFYLYIFILLVVNLWKTEYITEYDSLIIKRHIFEQTILILYYTKKKDFFSVLPKLRTRNFTKMGEYLQHCRHPHGEDLQWKGKVCNVANLPPWDAMLQTFRGEGLQGGRSAI